MVFYVGCNEIVFREFDAGKGWVLKTSKDGGSIAEILDGTNLINQLTSWVS